MLLSSSVLLVCLWSLHYCIFSPLLFLQVVFPFFVTDKSREYSQIRGMGVVCVMGKVCLCDKWCNGGWVKQEGCGGDMGRVWWYNEEDNGGVM